VTSRIKKGVLRGPPWTKVLRSSPRPFAALRGQGFYEALRGPLWTHWQSSTILANQNSCDCLRKNPKKVTKAAESCHMVKDFTIEPLSGKGPPKNRDKLCQNPSAPLPRAAPCLSLLTPFHSLLVYCVFRSPSWTKEMFNVALRITSRNDRHRYLMTAPECQRNLATDQCSSDYHSSDRVFPKLLSVRRD